MYDRDACAVDKADSSALAETSEFEEHCEGYETLGHHLHKAIVRESLREEMLPMLAHASEIIMLEIAE